MTSAPRLGRLLVVDDHPASVDIMAEYFTHAGYEVLGAHNGRDALGMVQLHQPDVVLLDIRMPGMTGIEVLQQQPSPRCARLRAKAVRLRDPPPMRRRCHHRRRGMLKRILLVDDEPELLECFAGQRPDVVFLDVNMPGLNGVEVLEYGHRHHRGFSEGRGLRLCPQTVQPRVHGPHGRDRRRPDATTFGVSDVGTIEMDARPLAGRLMSCRTAQTCAPRLGGYSNRPPQGGRRVAELPRCASCRVTITPGQNVVFRADARVEHAECPEVACPLCSRSISPHDPIRRDGEAMVHGNCWMRRERAAARPPVKILPEPNGIASVVRARLTAGRLPRIDVEKVGAAWGTGLACSGCDHTITPTEIEHDVEVNGDRSGLRFHRNCLSIWQREVANLRREIAGGSAASPWTLVFDLRIARHAARDLAAHRELLAANAESLLSAASTRALSRRVRDARRRA